MEEFIFLFPLDYIFPHNFGYLSLGYKKIPLSEFSLIVSFPCSGYGIAAQALTAIIRAHDGRGPHTMLTSSILQMLDLVSPDELIGYQSEN